MTRADRLAELAERWPTLTRRELEALDHALENPGVASERRQASYLRAEGEDPK